MVWVCRNVWQRSMKTRRTNFRSFIILFWWHQSYIYKIIFLTGLGLQEQRIPTPVHIIGNSLHWNSATGPRPLLVSPLVGDGLEATVHPWGGGDRHCDRPLQGESIVASCNHETPVQGLHTTRYVKTVYRQLHEEANMVVPVTGGPGYRTIRDFRSVLLKIGQFPSHPHQVV